MSSVTPIGAGGSTIPKHISKLHSVSRELQEVEAMILENEERSQRNVEDLKALGVEYTDLQKKHEKVELEKVELEEEVKKWKSECEKYQKKLVQAKSDGRLLLHEKEEELNKLKEKIAETENSANLWQNKYERNQLRVQKLIEIAALFFRADPDMAKAAEESVGLSGLGLCFNDLFNKTSLESTGNGLKDVREIDDDRYDAMPATGKRPVHSTVNNNITSSCMDELSSKCRRTQRVQSATTRSNPLDFGQSEGKIFEFEADMRRAINIDDELCMSAVCAIHRQETNPRPFDAPANGGFSPTDTIRGRSLAKFLTDGDPQGKRRKSVKELQDHDPKGIDECRRLASNHLKQLFQIYQKEQDLYFSPLSISVQAHW